MTRLIPALTIRRPWTTLILNHGKQVENRTWSTTYRGPLLLHAGQGFDGADARRMATLAGVDLPPQFWQPNSHPIGIVAVVDLIDDDQPAICSASTTAKRNRRCECGPWAIPGQFHWRFTNPRIVPAPVPARGALSLWTPIPEVVDAVRRQLAPPDPAPALVRPTVPPADRLAFARPTIMRLGGHRPVVDPDLGRAGQYGYRTHHAVVRAGASS